MFIDKYPVFTAGRVLKHEMLSLLRDYPRDYIDILYSNYADGVVAGCGITTLSADTISITPGLVRHRGRMYTLRKSITLPYAPTGQYTMIKVMFGKEKESGDYGICKGDILSTLNLKLAENELELCRFKLKSGARLRDTYQDFGDMATDYDTVNIVNVPFSAPHESTLSPLITRRFAQEALLSRPVHAFDYVFISHCAQGLPVARMLITAYTAARLGVVTTDSTNHDMHRHLAQILIDISLGKDMATARGPGRVRTILVD